MVDVEARVHSLPSEGLFAAGRRLGERGAAAGAGHRVQVNRMDELAGGVVLEGHLHRIAHADAVHGSGDFAAEGEVVVGGAIGQLPGDLHRLKADAMGDGTPAADGGRNFRGVADDAHGLDLGLLSGTLADDEFAFHACRAMAGDGAEVGEGAFLVRHKADLCLAPLGCDASRSSVEVRERDVMLNAIAVDEGNVDVRAKGDLDGRIADLINGPADAHEGELTVLKIGG